MWLFKYLIVLGLTLSVVQAATVYTEVEVIFSCGGFSSEIRSDLARQCDSIGEKFSQLISYDCVSAGDDGGYVNYYVIKAFAECN